MVVDIEDGEHAEIIFVEEFEDVFFVGIHGDGDKRFGFEFNHVLFGSSEEDASDGNSSGEMAELVENNDGVQLFEIEILFAEPIEDLIARNGFTDKGKFGVHHAARGGGIEGEEFADVVGFAIGHFLEEFVGGLLGKIGEKIGGSVRRHFFNDIRGFFGIEFFDDLGSEALVKFGENSRSGFFVERSNDALALSGRELFHHLGEVCGVEVFEFLVRNAELHAAKRVRLNEIDEFPADGALGKFALQLSNETGWRKALKEATNSARHADIDLRDTKFNVSVGVKLGQVDIIDAYDFTSRSVDDLLVEKIFLNGKPAFVGLIGIESPFGDVEIDAAGDGFGDLVIARDERLEAAARNQIVRNAIGGVGRFDEEFTDAADVVVAGIVSGGAHKFRGVEHTGWGTPFSRANTGELVKLV
jgi:hypothetical protein